MSWYVYMVRCRSGALYTGISTDVEARVKKHNSGKGARSVKALGLPVELVYSREMGSRSRASKIEVFLKGLDKERKEKFVKIGQVDWGKQDA